MDQTEVYCEAAEQWYISRFPDYKDRMSSTLSFTLIFDFNWYMICIVTNGGERTGADHYKRYFMEYGAYWNADICVDSIILPFLSYT